MTIPVMAKCRIGHFAEAQILQALEIDYIDESEVLTPADLEHHVDKWQFTVPFVCGCTNLGEALRRIAEGAAMIRTKGEAGTGDIVNAVTHMRSVFGHIRRLGALREEELYAEAKELRAPYELVKWVAENGKLPVVTFTAGGIATPADASLCMQLGADGVFVGSGIFKSGDPERRAKAIVEATTHFQDAGDPRPRLGRPRRADGRHLDAVARPERAARDPRLVVPEAPLQESGSGLAPTGPGWFVLNVGDAMWLTTEGGEKKRSGSECSFETPPAEFEQVGVRIHVLPPGEPNGCYHAENQQEDFLVLSGECTLLVEGRGADAPRLGLLPRPGRDGAHLRGRRRRALRHPDGRLANGRLDRPVPGLRARRPSRGERRARDVQSGRGVRRVGAVAPRAAVRLGQPALDIAG